MLEDDSSGRVRWRLRTNTIVLSISALAVCALMGCGAGDSARKTAGEHLIAARKALSAGDSSTAMAEMSASIEVQPSFWAYMERAKLYLKQGNEKAALADGESALKLEPGNQDVKWLLGEIKKPPKQRFKGPFAQPPSFKK